ncbi:MAG: flagellar filament capping protein FliD [Planctomycetes bacterium]|nr:flagellar filament capping protein FliD [Planctomycetota bacterium]
MAASLISFGGMASGLDTQSIIAALVGVRKQPIALLEARKAEYSQLRTRYNQLRDKLEKLQSKAEDLKQATDFLSFSAVSSDTTVLDVSAEGSASETSFAVVVSALAAAESEASTGFADYDTTHLGTGTLKITLAGTQHDVAVASGEDTLEGIRDAINDAEIGVTATIVNEGTGANPYKLVVTSDDTGAANTISFSDDQGGSGLAATLNFGNVQPAADAVVQINGLTVHRATNVVDDVVPGVTFTLLKAGTSTVTLNADLGSIKKKVQEYVDAHSDLISFINNEIKVSDITDQAGAFNGEATVRGIKNRILAQYTLSSYPGGALSTLAEVGITLENDGTLTFDESDFDDAAEESLDDVTGLFTTSGDAIGGAGFSLYHVPDTLAAGDYAVNVTQAATKAATQATQAFPTGGLSADEKLTFTLGADTVEVQLASGDSLADVVGKVNDALDDAGIGVTASDQAGVLSFTADAYGSASSFSVVSDTAVGPGSTGVGASPLAAAGLDVQGTIGGQAASGAGQYLTGSGDFAEVELRYTGTAPAATTLTVGPDGFFVKMDDLLDDALLPLTGPIDARLDALDDTIEDIEDRVDSLDQRAEQYREMLVRQFAALESLIGKLQAQQSYLATFAANWSTSS